MAVIFKVAFALLALCAIAYAFPAEASQTEVQQKVIEGVHTAADQPQAAENKAQEQHAQHSSSATEDAHSRHKRGCKTITYKKGGRTITAQKC